MCEPRRWSLSSWYISNYLCAFFSPFSRERDQEGETSTHHILLRPPAVKRPYLLLSSTGSWELGTGLIPVLFRGVEMGPGHFGARWLKGQHPWLCLYLPSTSISNLSCVYFLTVSDFIPVLSLIQVGAVRMYQATVYPRCWVCSWHAAELL